MKKITAVIFDMDGLIFDTERLKLRVWERVGAEMGYENFGENLYPNLGRNRDREYFHETYGDSFPFEQFQSLCSKYIEQELAANGPEPKPGLFSLLRYLKDHNYLTAIATSSHQDMTMRHLKSVGIEEYFSKIITGDKISKSKPHPESYLTACKALNVDPSHALVLEDSKNGIKAGLAAGASVIMIPDLLKSFPELEPSLAAKLDTLADVVTWLDRNNH